MRSQGLRSGRVASLAPPCYDICHNSRILLYYDFDSESLHWIVNISLNLIAFFLQNKVSLLLSILYHADDVTITSKVSKYNDVAMPS